MFAVALDADEYTPGQVVEGRAIFRAEKPVTPKHVRLELVWNTRGRGDASGGVLATADGEIGPVAAGQTVETPFRVRLPETVPRSFAGELIELYYAVRGRVDLPWAFDETAETEFGVVPAPAD